MSLLRETLALAVTDSGRLALAALAHVALVSAALLLALLSGLPAGLAAARRTGVVPGESGLWGLPLPALWGLVLAPLLAWPGGGSLAALAVVWLYGHVTLSRAVQRALAVLDPALHEAALALGLTARQRLRLLEWPLLLPALLAGLRVVATVGISVVALAAFAGAGGLGVWLTAGFAGHDRRSLLLGLLAVAALALVVDGILRAVQQRLTPVGLDDGSC